MTTATETKVYPKMDRKLKKKWIAALRSGDFQQGKEYLATRRVSGGSYRYCCLGVLCELTDGVTHITEEGLAGRTDVIRKSYQTVSAEDSFNYDGSNAYLPEGMVEAVKVPFEVQDILADMNDDGASFAEIADWIERNL